MLKIAHRGNLFGKTDQENHILYLLKAVEAGFGVETDILRAPCGRLIISHDPIEWTPTNDAALVLKNLIERNAFIALNIKEEGLLEDLLKIVDPSEFKGFVFDFELCCSDPENEIKQYQRADFKIARRISDRGEKITGPCDYIWMDEMDSTNSISIFMNDLNPHKIVYVSPELHGRPVEERRKDIHSAICTDYCFDFPE